MVKKKLLAMTTKGIVRNLELILGKILPFQNVPTRRLLQFLLVTTRVVGLGTRNFYVRKYFLIDLSGCFGLFIIIIMKLVG